MLGPMELLLFDEVGDTVRGLLPPELGQPRLRIRRYGLKLWFGSVTPTRDHYEAQVMGARHVPEATTLAIEVGFHLEHPKQSDNDAALAQLLGAESRWRRVLGREPVAGAFVGRPDDWRRVSELWPDPDLGDPELAFELAARLTDYITALEPIRRATR